MRIAARLLILAFLGVTGCGDLSDSVSYDEFAGAEAMSATELSAHVDVRAVDVRFPEDNPEKSGKILWEAFANNPHESSFNSVALTEQSNDEYWEALKSAILERAAALPAQHEGLARFLESVYPHSWALLIPVASYAVRVGREPAWVIIGKWEGRGDRPLGLSHIHMWLISGASGEILAEERCM